MRRVPLFSLVLVLLFAGTWWLRVGRRPPPTSNWAVPTCDSAAAVRVAIDSLARTDPFRSRIFRFQRDSQGLRITTMPDQHLQPGILDGMAVVLVGPRCSIISVVRGDSA